MKCYSCIKCSVWFVVFVFFRYSSHFLKFSHFSFWGPHITFLLVTPRPFVHCDSADRGAQHLQETWTLDGSKSILRELSPKSPKSPKVPCLTAPSKSPRSAWHLNILDSASTCIPSRDCSILVWFISKISMSFVKSFYNVLTNLKLFSYPFEALVQAGEATSLEAQ